MYIITFYILLRKIVKGVDSYYLNKCPIVLID